jgi:hypothetical protein
MIMIEHNDDYRVIDNSNEPAKNAPIKRALHVVPRFLGILLVVWGVFIGHSINAFSLSLLLEFFRAEPWDAILTLCLHLGITGASIGVGSEFFFLKKDAVTSSGVCAATLGIGFVILWFLSSADDSLRFDRELEMLIVTALSAFIFLALLFYSKQLKRRKVLRP